MKVSLVSFGIIDNDWSGNRSLILSFLNLYELTLAIHIFHIRLLDRRLDIHLALSQAKAIICLINNSCSLLVVQLLQYLVVSLSYLIQASLDIDDLLVDSFSFGYLFLQVSDLLLILRSDFSYFSA